MYPLGALLACGVDLPHGGWREAGDDDHAREQAAKHAVADDQFRWHDVGALARVGDRVIGRGRQREQHRLLAQRVRHRRQARAGRDDARSGAAEQPAHLAIAARARHEDPLAHRQAAVGAGLHHAADRLVAGHQWVAHAGECGHGAIPKKALCTRADTTEFHRDFDVCRAHFRQRQTCQSQ